MNNRFILKLFYWTNINKSIAFITFKTVILKDSWYNLQNITLIVAKCDIDLCGKGNLGVFWLPQSEWHRCCLTRPPIASRSNEILLPRHCRVASQIEPGNNLVPPISLVLYFSLNWIEDTRALHVAILVDPLITFQCTYLLQRRRAIDFFQEQRQYLNDIFYSAWAESHDINFAEVCETPTGL